jgi:phage terminase Nu1 subunit (DNA packaging protein)
MPIDLTKQTTQVAFGQLVGVGPRTVTQLLSRGILARGCTGAEWLLAYTRHLREVAARHQSADGRLDLVAERAALTLEQRQIASIKRRTLEGELIEVAGLKTELGRQFGAIREGLLTVAARVTPRLNLSGPQTALIDAEIRAVLAQYVGVA